MRRLRRIHVLAALAALLGCNQPMPSWQQLLAGKIAQQYPQYATSPGEGGRLLVHRPGRPDIPVDVNAIAAFCQRGPKDCNYATDQMLLELRQ